MTLTQLKATAASLGITADAARAHGHIGHKATWQAAIEAAKQSATEAQQPATDTAVTICDVIYSDASRSIVQWVATAILMVVFTIGLLAYRITQAVWRLTAPHRQRLAQQRDEWFAAQASYVALVLLLLKSA
jgi:hypothetical protein